MSKLWEMICAGAGFVLALVMALFLGKSKAEKKQAEKEAKQAQEQVQQEQKYKEEAHKIKEEIFKETESEKQKLNTGDNTDRFNSAINILRKHT